MILVGVLVILLIISAIGLVKGHSAAIRFNRNDHNLVIGATYKDLRPYRILRCIWLIMLLLCVLLWMRWSRNNQAHISENIKIGAIDTQSRIINNSTKTSSDTTTTTIIKDERCPENEHWENGCYNNTRPIEIPNGLGEEHWLGDRRSEGIIMECNEGYIVVAGMCIDINSLPAGIKEKLSKKRNQSLPNDCDRGVVDRVIDGDTIVVEGNKVRLIGIDTPESVDPNKPIEPYAIEASKVMSNIVEGQEVCLAMDSQSNSKDIYNRLLRYVYLKDGTFVNAELIKSGYAHAYVRFPFDFLQRFQDLEDIARKQKIGLWISE